MKIGDFVSVIDDVLCGKISAIDRDLITFVTEDGFEFQYAENEVIVIDGFDLEIDKNKPSIAVILSKKEMKNRKKSTKKLKRKPKNQSALEVDLHIEKLVGSPEKMEPNKILSFQLEVVKKKLRFAFDKKIRRIVFIHGVGEGVLKSELRFLLKKYNNLKFYDADYAKYGLGATEVYIFQQKR